MLPSKNRLKFSRRNREKNQGQKISTENFTLIFAKGSESLKVGVIVSKKVAPKATDRNRIKRLFYESTRDKMKSLKGELKIIIKKNLANLKEQQVAVKLNEATKRIR